MKKQIIAVFKTHFDIGFTGLACEVMEKITGGMMREVVDTCMALEHQPPGRRFVWTMPAWPLEQALAANRGRPIMRDIERLIDKGLICWHALPYTTHTEFCGHEEFIRGLLCARRLEVRYGRRTVCAKMTDVPGHTWALPSLLAGTGVEFLHLGCNPASMPPQVPRLFFWQGPDGRRVLTFYSKGGYGSALQPPQDWPFPVWLAMMNTNDNTGPQNASVVTQLAAQAATSCPGYEFTTGTLDDFYLALKECDLSGLPVVCGDLADSWIHGVGSYPDEVGRLRVARECLKSLEKLATAMFAADADTGRAKQAAEYAAQAYDAALLFGEHTWGMDVKSVLPPDRPYGKDDLARLKQTDPRYRRIEQSWQEQRKRIAAVEQEIGSLYTLAAGGRGKMPGEGAACVWDSLAAAAPGARQLYTEADTEDCWLQDPQTGEEYPVLGGWVSPGVAHPLQMVGYTLVRKPLPPVEKNTSCTIENAFYRIEAGACGGIASLYDKRAGKEWVRPGSRGLFHYRYDIHGGQDIRDYIAGYSYRFYDWSVADFGRLNYPPEQPHLTWYGQKAEVCAWRQGSMQYLRIRAVSPPDSHLEYGNPAETVLTVRLEDASPFIDIDFCAKCKPETPCVESGHLVLPLTLEEPGILVNKMGSVVNIQDDILPCANNGLYCCEHWMSAREDGNEIQIIPLDTPLFSVGSPKIYKYTPEYRAEEPTLYFNLFNNSWGTNFPQWMGGDYRFRCRLHTGQPATAAVKTRRALAAMTPLVLLPGSAGPIGNRWQPVWDMEDVELVAYKPALVGEGYILRLRNLSATSVPIHREHIAQEGAAIMCDHTERPLRPFVPGVEVTIGPFETITLWLSKELPA